MVDLPKKNLNERKMCEISLAWSKNITKPLKVRFYCSIYFTISCWILGIYSKGFFQLQQGRTTHVELQFLLVLFPTRLIDPTITNNFNAWHILMKIREYKTMENRIKFSEINYETVLKFYAVVGHGLVNVSKEKHKSESKMKFLSYLFWAMY